MARPSYSAHLIAKTPVVDDIVAFRLEKPPGYDYRPGQWFVITFNDAGGDHVHHFSHSNSPSESELEFATRVRPSEFKAALDSLPLGTTVEIEGPYGSFGLPEEPGKVAFLTGGIGITCVRSILRWLAGYPAAGPAAGPPGRSMPEEMVLIFANRSEAAIPFQEELSRIQTTLPQLRVVHAISRPSPHWSGHHGHIDLDLLTRELPEPEDWSYYLSGPPSLVQAMRDVLLEWDIEPGSITAERFEGYE